MTRFSLLGKGTETTPLHQVISHFEQSLGFAYKPHWGYVLEVSQELFKRFGSSSSPLLNRLLQHMGELHETKDFTYLPKLGRAFILILFSLLLSV
jgi:hypothetical protein